MGWEMKMVAVKRDKRLTFVYSGFRSLSEDNLSFFNRRVMRLLEMK
jgi:hypothetical protein